jgi:hypothetical protein
VLRHLIAFITWRGGWVLRHRIAFIIYHLACTWVLRHRMALLTWRAQARRRLPVLAVLAPARIPEKNKRRPKKTAKK